MILVFILLGIIIIISLLFLVLILSTIKIEIERLHIHNLSTDKKYLITFKLYFLNKVKIFSISIDYEKIEKIKKNNRFKNVKIDSLYKKVLNPKVIYKIFKRSNLIVERLKLELEVGVESADVTAYLTAAIAEVISIILSRSTKNEICENVYYNVKPVYNKFTLNIDLESIISLKIVNIIIVIYSIYKLLKKGSGKNGRTSNRRSYVSSYEFN